MALVGSSKGLKSLAKTSLICRVLYFSSQTPTSTRSPRKISSVQRDPKKLTQDGDGITRKFRSQIKNFRNRGRFSQALQIFGEMTKQQNFTLSPDDITTNLDLISKVNGIEEAEKYFNTIPKPKLTPQIYLSLLNCYTHHKHLEKAESLILKTEQLGLPTSTFHDTLLKLYYDTRHYEKLHFLVQETKKNNFTLGIQLHAYAAKSDINGIEKTLNTIEEDPEVFPSWKYYAIASDEYIKAGMMEKGLEMLKKAARLIMGKKHKRKWRGVVFDLFRKIGRKDELWWFWNEYSSFGKVNRRTCRCMVRCLLEMGDFEGAKKIVEEQCGDDFKVKKMVVNALGEDWLYGVVTKA